jgi:drug/metabolite transporter (DMT)-like permease
MLFSKKHIDRLGSLLFTCISMISEAVKLIGAANATLTETVGPIMTSIMAVVLLNEVFTLYHGLGMVLVILGVSRLKPKTIKV